MKTLKLYSLIIALICVSIFVNSTSLAFAFFDGTSSSASFSNIQVGNWTQLISTIIDFEGFTNTTSGAITTTINGIEWQATNLVAGNTTNDQKNGATAGRITGGTGENYMVTTSYFTNLQTISFYVGLSLNSPTQGQRKYRLEVSHNGTDWAVLADNVGTSTSFDFVSADMATLLANGLLIGGTTADATTPLMIRIYYTSKSTTIYNIDDITIDYIS